jgi:hypothetical protein
MVDMVNHPPHYTHGGVEVIEITRHCSFDIGNAIKYIARYEHKGSPEQDLRKALWYLKDHIEHYGKRYTMPDGAYDSLYRFIEGMPEESDRLGTDLILMDIMDGFISIAAKNLTNRIDRDFG